MRNSAWILLIAVILLLLVTTQGIVQAKLYQLKVSVSQDRLMNFEISSEALRSRFKEIFQNPDDYKSELKRSVIESGILNNVEPGELEANIVVRIGVAFSNSVRLMSLKPILRLNQDRKVILLIKYAFFMERNRRMDIAAKKYEEVINLSEENEKNNMFGFSLLHAGYSYATIGEREKAINFLQKTVDIMPGTHFAQTAVILLNLLLESERTEKTILEQKTSNVDKARTFFKSGLYKNACTFYDKSGNINSEDKYKKARCREETGKSKEAIVIYKELANSNGQVALLSNRRLLILSKLYKAGDDIAKIAEKNSKRLFDKVAEDEINSAAKEQKKAVVVKEIISNFKDIQSREDKKEVVEEGEKELLKEIGKELTDNVVIENSDKISLDIEIKKREEEDKRLAAEKERELLKKKKQEELTQAELKRKKELEEKLLILNKEKELRLKNEAQENAKIALLAKKEEEQRILYEKRKQKEEEIAYKKAEEERLKLLNENNLKQKSEEENKIKIAKAKELKQKLEEKKKIALLEAKAKKALVQEKLKNSQSNNPLDYFFIKFNLSDGRNFKCKKVLIQGDNFILELEGLKTYIPISNLSSLNLLNMLQVENKEFKVSIVFTFKDSKIVKAKRAEFLSDFIHVKINEKLYEVHDLLQLSIVKL